MKNFDFSQVDLLTQMMTRNEPRAQRFSVDLPERDVANGLYAAWRAIVQERGRQLQFDDDARQQVLTVARWLTDSAQPFGLLMAGGCGNGKTSLASAVVRLVALLGSMTDNPLRPTSLHFVTSRQYCELFASDQRGTSTRSELDPVKCAQILVIDDMGEEPGVVTVYGNHHSPVSDLLLYRYDRQLTTIVTTNLTREQIAEKYGARLYDRFKEMFAILAFNNSSYRREV